MGQTRREKELAKFYDTVYTITTDKLRGNPEDRDFFCYETILPYLKDSFNLLDFGCGDGHTIFFLRTFFPDGKYTGVDLSRVILKVARYLNPDAKFYTSIPDGAYYDIVLCMGVAEHADHPDEQLAMLGDRLNEGGVLYLEAPNCLEYSDEKHEGFRKPRETSLQEEWHWKRETWEKVIGDAGLEIIESRKGLFPLYEFVWLLKKR